jgi:hypothetical protein
MAIQYFVLFVVCIAMIGHLFDKPTISYDLIVIDGDVIEVPTRNGEAVLDMFDKAFRPRVLEEWRRHNAVLREHYHKQWVLSKQELMHRHKLTELKIVEEYDA